MKGLGPLVLCLALALSFAFLSCRAPAIQPGKKSVVVTYSILGSIVRDLFGTQANITVSVPNGLDPHEFEPSARDIEAINKADLVVQNGLGLEGGMEKTLAVARDKGVKFFTATDYIAIRHVSAGEGIPGAIGDQAVGAPDPHFWTDPLQIKSVVAALAPVLKAEFNIDVSSRAADLESQLDKLNTDTLAMLSLVPQADRKLVTGHESMGYFAQRYGFKLVGVIVPSLSSQAGVSAADLAYIEKAVRDNQVKAIFTELGTSPVVAQTINKDTGARVVELTTHALPPDGSYATFLKNVATTIADALK